MGNPLKCPRYREGAITSEALVTGGGEESPQGPRYRGGGYPPVPGLFFLRKRERVGGGHPTTAHRATRPAPAAVTSERRAGSGAAG